MAAIRSQHFDPRHIDLNVGSRAHQKAFRIDLMTRVSFRMKSITEVVDVEKLKCLTAERLRPRGRNLRFGGLHRTSRAHRFAAVRQHPGIARPAKNIRPQRVALTIIDAYH